MKNYYFLLVLMALLVQTQCVYAQLGSSPKAKERGERKDKAIKEGKPWLSPIIAPAYTADAGFLVSAGMLYSFRVNKNDTISQRSTLPATIFYSSKGNFGIRTFLKTFWFEDRLRFNSNLTIRDKDNNYYGKGFEQIDNTHKSDTTTLYHETTASLEIDLIYKLKTSLYAGIKLKPAYAKTNNFAPPVEKDPYRSKFEENYFLNGIGAQLAYDTRDVVVNAWEGLFLNVSTLFYDKLWGSKYDFRVVAFDARYYRTLFRKGNVLAFRSFLRSTNGEVPITELSDFSGGKQMRGYLLGHYRDNTMALGIGEWRYTFKKSDGNLSKSGMVLWLGTASIGADVGKLKKWLPNAGVGYRFELQPRMNVCVDFGVGRDSKGVYFNFTEAF